MSETNNNYNPSFLKDLTFYQLFEFKLNMDYPLRVSLFNKGFTTRDSQILHLLLLGNDVDLHSTF
jgi:hypothetical protein